MITKFVWSLKLAIALSICILILAANANSILMHAYKASYDEFSTLGGHITRTYIYDGHGHGRVETINEKGKRSIGIIDATNKTIALITDSSKIPITIPLTDEDFLDFAQNNQAMKSKTKDLGVKKIDGHLCTGTEYNLHPGVTQEIWIGNDIGIRVYSVVRGGAMGKVVSHLKSYSN
jgi:hypothetical protein